MIYRDFKGPFGSIGKLIFKKCKEIRQPLELFIRWYGYEGMWQLIVKFEFDINL